MSPTDEVAPPARTRADARRNRATVVDAAARVFVHAGVDAPVRDVAAAAGVGMGTVYRHFPTRADLVIAVYRHQVDECATVGAELVDSGDPMAALSDWAEKFVDFLVTKHGLATALQSGDARFESLHAYFLDRLAPVCDALVSAAATRGRIRSDVTGYEVLRTIGNICAGTAADPTFDARKMTRLFVGGLAVT